MTTEALTPERTMAENSGGKVASATDVREAANAILVGSRENAKHSMILAGVQAARAARFNALADALEALIKANAGCARKLTPNCDCGDIAANRVLLCGDCDRARCVAITLLTQGEKWNSERSR